MACALLHILVWMPAALVSNPRRPSRKQMISSLAEDDLGVEGAIPGLDLAEVLIVEAYIVFMTFYEEGLWY